jgi:hypothetical protein
MDLADLLRVLFYLWLFIALGVWAVRIYRRLFVHDADDSLGALPDDSSATNRKATTTGGAAKTPKATNASKASKITKGPTRLPDLTSPADLGGEEPGDRVKAVIREELERKRQAEGGDAVALPAAGAAPSAPAPSRGGLFAPEADAPATPSLEVADALKGISMPCELAPTSLADERDDPYVAAFVTTGFSARTVAAQVADELERLGYAIHTERENIAVAVRPDAELRVEIVEDAAMARSGGDRRFPYVPNGSVAVVITSR